MQNNNQIKDESGNSHNHMLVAELFYYGTALDCAGHFHWKLSDNKMTKTNISYKSIPFNPDDLVDLYVGKGKTQYFEFENYKVISITGSCFDNRCGTKSVFYTTENISLLDFKDIISSIPIASKIINQMPFAVYW